LIENGFQGKEGQKVPQMTDEVVQSISDRYKELYAYVMGEPLPALLASNIQERIQKNIVNSIK
jgi:phosphoribosylaminoimidazole-succinocarboxamide synthase